MAANESFNRILGLGSLYRRCGTFYIDRAAMISNPVYLAIVRAYIEFLLSRGLDMEMFIEGAISTTGKVGQPRTGMLRIITEFLLHSPRLQDTDVIVVPVVIGVSRH